MRTFGRVRTPTASRTAGSSDESATRQQALPSHRPRGALAGPGGKISGRARGHAHPMTHRSRDSIVDGRSWIIGSCQRRQARRSRVQERRHGDSFSVVSDAGRPAPAQPRASPISVPDRTVPRWAGVARRRRRSARVGKYETTRCRDFHPTSRDDARRRDRATRTPHNLGRTQRGKQIYSGPLPPSPPRPYCSGRKSCNGRTTRLSSLVGASVPPRPTLHTLAAAAAAAAAGSSVHAVFIRLDCLADLVGEKDRRQHVFHLP